MFSTDRFVLHIGRHKSGTSSLQRYLHSNRVALAGQGILYPETGLENIAHHPLAHALSAVSIRRDPESTAAQIRQFDEALTREIRDWSGRVVFSSERFQGANPAAVEKIFGKQCTQIVVYIREQSDYIVSAYQQMVHAQAHVGCLADFVAGAIADYDKFLGAWRLTYGQDRMIVRCYQRDHLLNGDVIDDFMQAIGVEGRLPTEIGDGNPSIGGALLELKRLLNRTMQPEVPARRLYGIFSAAALKSPVFRERPELLKASTDEIFARIGQSNARVVDRYFGGVNPFRPMKYSDSIKPLKGSDFVAAIAAIHEIDRGASMQICQQLVNFSRPSGDDPVALAKRLRRDAATANVAGVLKYFHRINEYLVAEGWLWNFDVDWSS
jgi:hypothetical protein